MVTERRFSGRVFWLSYFGFVLFWVFVLARWDPLDLTGTMFFVCTVIFPVPFVLFGHFARHVSFSMLYALVVLLLSYVMFFYGLPAIERLIYPRYMTEPQKENASR